MGLYVGVEGEKFGGSYFIFKCWKIGMFGDIMLFEIFVVFWLLVGVV